MKKSFLVGPRRSFVKNNAAIFSAARKIPKDYRKRVSMSKDWGLPGLIPKAYLLQVMHSVVSLISTQLFFKYFFVIESFR